jgi:hypothetical protein
VGSEGFGGDEMDVMDGEDGEGIPLR